MKRKINIIREKLHKEIEAEEVNKDNIIKISKELDELIIQYYMEEDKKEKK